MKRDMILLWRQLLIAVICLAAPAREILANDIAVTNVLLTELNTVNSNIFVQLDLSWKNSWRTVTPPNWDAAWLFVKYRLEGSNDWQHAELDTAGHVAPAGSVITNADAAGAFIYRNANGTGDVSYSHLKLRWNYGAAGLEKGDHVAVSVHAIEMVYIPQGSFYVGDGTSSDIRGQFEASTNGTPYQVTNESYVIVLGGGTAGSLGNNNAAGMNTADDFDDATSKSLLAAFPKGYNAFYCMKYEISQGQYAAFLNELTNTQDDSRRQGTLPTTYRYTITGNYTNYSASRPDRACNYLTWADGAAYADWAGLRPITELEFEKVCRGPLAPVANEYAWGTATIVADAALVLSGAEDGTETVTGPGTLTNGATVYGNNGHSGGDGGNGPLRCGIFAASTNKPTRALAGATYYGVMEMSGNLAERPVTVGNSTGRSFTGAHGDGVLDASGNANAANWPGSGAVGSGFRGGCWTYTELNLRVSDRIYGALTGSVRSDHYTWRAARSAP